MPQPSEKATRRWFFQINVNTTDLATLAKIREMIENALFLDPTAAVHERSMMTKLVDVEGGEVYVEADGAFNHVN